MTTIRDTPETDAILHEQDIAQARFLGNATNLKFLKMRHRKEFMDHARKLEKQRDVLLAVLLEMEKSGVLESGMSSALERQARAAIAKATAK